MYEYYIAVNASLPPISSFNVVAILFMLVVIVLMVLIWLEVSACLEILTEMAKLSKEKGGE